MTQTETNYDALVGSRVSRVEYVQGEKRDEDSGYVVIEFSDGLTLYADAPTLYGLPEPGEYGYEDSQRREP
jgi:hypothetical protein